MILGWLACTGVPAPTPDSEPPPETGVDSAGATAPAGGDTSGPERVYEIERVQQTTLPTARGPGAVISSRRSGLVLLPEGSGEVLRVMSGLYVAPSGDYCLDGGSGASCEGGVLWTADRIEPGGIVARTCFDDHHGRLFLVHESGGTVEVVDVDPAGDEPYTFLFSYDVVKVSEELGEQASWSGGADRGGGLPLRLGRRGQRALHGRRGAGLGASLGDPGRLLPLITARPGAAGSAPGR